MWGYAARRDKPSLGIHDRLYARALVFEVGKQRLALVSLDLGRAPIRASVLAIQTRVKRACRVETIFLVGSHTHHGPVLELEGWPTAKQSYVRKLEQKIGNAIIAAVRCLEPAQIGVGSRQTTLNRNRHSKQKEKPVDRELLVLRVENAQGKVIAHAVNFAAHATLRPNGLRKISADFPGIMAAEVEKATGGAPCLFLQGAAGDLSPNPPGDAADADKFGKALAAQVLALAKKIKVEEPKKPTLEVREEEFAFTPRIDLENEGVGLILSAAFFPDLVAFYRQEYKTGVRPRLTTALLNGDIGFVGVSGEFFCEHALSLKRRARLPNLFFLGYCNDYQQYFPTIEAFAEGGYGTEPWISPAPVGAGEKIMNRALIHLFKMRGKLKGAK
jgi:hypothetical protein